MHQRHQTQMELQSHLTRHGKLLHRCINFYFTVPLASKHKTLLGRDGVRNKITSIRNNRNDGQVIRARRRKGYIATDMLSSEMCASEIPLLACSTTATLLTPFVGDPINFNSLRWISGTDVAPSCHRRCGSRRGRGRWSGSNRRRSIIRFLLCFLLAL
jgi:hypothetical protein